MIQKSVAALAVLALLALSSPSGGQASKPAGANVANTSSTSGSGASAAKPSEGAEAQPQILPGTPTDSGTAAPNAGARNDCNGGNCDLPHIAISTPAPAPAPWLWQERVAWGANLVLVVLGYVGIMLAISLLRKIERGTRHAEEATLAAAESARAAVKLAESLQRADRPWILMGVRPAQNIENGFTVVAMNRGRGAARIETTVEEKVVAIDEQHLAPTPVYKDQPARPTDPIILLPGESADLASFSRTDARDACDSEEQFQRVENWEEKVFLYGKITYSDLAAPDDAPLHESSWCCWYIHGRQKSGMVMAGPPAYNKHT
jgi:hypothetical protein